MAVPAFLAPWIERIARTLGPWGSLVIVILVAGVLALAGGRLIAKVFQKLTGRTKTRIDDLVAAALWPAIGVLLFAALAHVGLTAFNPYIDTGVLEGWAPIQFVLVALIVAFSLTRVAKSIGDYRVGLKPELRPMASLGTRAASLVIWVTAILVVMSQFKVNVGPVLASLGIAGLAVALALQDTLANFFSGVWIQASQTFRRGHFVQLEESKIQGWIDEVGWRTTKIRTPPGNLVVVPNQTMARATITDFHLPRTQVGTNVLFQVGYETDPDLVTKKVLEEVEAAMKEKPEWFVAEPTPAVRIEALADHGVQYVCNFQTSFVWFQGPAQSLVRTRILRRLVSEGIGMPFPVRMPKREPTQS